MSSAESRKTLDEQDRKRKKSVDRKDRDANSDLFQALFPIYHLNKICGLLPVKFVEQSPGRYHGRLHCFGVFYSVSLLTVLIGGEIWGLWRDLRDGWEHSTRLRSQTAVLVTCSDVLGVMILTSVSIVGSLTRWKHLELVIDKLIQVDEKLGIVSPRRTRRFSALISVASLAYVWLVSGLDFYCWDLDTRRSKKRSDKGAVNFVSLYFMYMVIITMETQYAVSAYNVGERLERLNRCLDGVVRGGAIGEHFWKDLGLVDRLPRNSSGRLTRPGPTRTLASWEDSLAETISQLVTVHASLCDAVTSINRAYGPAMLVVTITCLLHLIITPYFLILEADGKRGWLFLAVQGLWCVLHVYRILVIVQPSYDAASKAKRTAVIVSQLFSAEVDTEARRQLEVFSLQLLHRPLEFSACGLFSIDRGLVTSIAGAVTTYLVILIQFQKADDEKGEISNVDSIIKNATQILRNASSLHNLTAFRFNV